MDIEVLVGGICMYKEMAYAIRPEKTNDFLRKLYSTSKGKDDWKNIKNESKVIDKKRLDTLFENKK